MDVFGKRMAALRKERKVTQFLVQPLSTSFSVIGRYELNTNTPSIEVLIKLAKVFNVSVDFLIGEGELAALDKDLLKRIEDIEKLDEDTKKHLFFLIDNVIQNYKTKKAFNK